MPGYLTPCLSTVSDLQEHTWPGLPIGACSALGLDHMLHKALHQGNVCHLSLAQLQHLETALGSLCPVSSAPGCQRVVGPHLPAVVAQTLGLLTASYSCRTPSATTAHESAFCSPEAVQ